MKTLNAELKSGSLRKVYLLYGDEAYLKQNLKNRFKKEIAGDDGMNLTVFQGRETKEDAVIDIAGTLPFFAERRLVIVEDSGWFKNKTEKLPDFLPGFPDTTVLLFVEEAVDRKTRMWKAVQKYGYAAELKHPDRKSLETWAARYLASAGKKITLSTMEIFLERTGDDMENVENELEKLISFLGERDVVTSQDIEEITTKSVTGQIFQMVEAIASRRTAEAMDLYNDLLTLREPPLRILALIARQYHQLLNVRGLTAEGKRREEIAAALKIPPFAVSKLERQARAMQTPAILERLKRCITLEEAVKTGDLDDRLAVELLITGG